jgi:hypothetical protein
VATRVTDPARVVVLGPQLVDRAAGLVKQSPSPLRERCSCSRPARGERRWSRSPYRWYPSRADPKPRLRAGAEAPC